MTGLIGFHSKNEGIFEWHELIVDSFHYSEFRTSSILDFKNGFDTGFLICFVFLIFVCIWRFFVMVWPLNKKNTSQVFYLEDYFNLFNKFYLLLIVLMISIIIILNLFQTVRLPFFLYFLPSLIIHNWYITLLAWKKSTFLKMSMNLI